MPPDGSQFPKDGPARDAQPVAAPALALDTDAGVVDPASETTESNNTAQHHAKDGMASHQPEQRRVPKDDFRVADVRQGAEDCCGDTIDDVFYKRPCYAVYRTGRHIRIQFANDPAQADNQFKSVAPLFEYRDRLEYLNRDMECRGDYHDQIANAFRVGLQGDVPAAEALLKGAILNATEQRARTGRLGYLIAAGVVSAALAAVLCVSGGLLVSPAADPANPLGLLLLAAGGGSLGALLSIATAIRSRTVAPDGHLWTNVTDGAVRIVIGVLSGAALYLLLTSGFVGIPWGDEKAVLQEAWRPALVVGFVAGFLERMVPDLLEKRKPFNEGVGEKAKTAEAG